VPTSSSINENLAICYNELQQTEKSVNQETNRGRCRSQSLLSIVTEGGQRRKSNRSAIKIQKHRISNNSSATPSLCDSTDPPCTTSNLLITPTLKVHNSTFLDYDPLSKNNGVQDLQDDQDFEISSVKSCEKNEVLDSSAVKPEKEDNNVVSTYFDIHFPSSSSTAHKPYLESIKPAAAGTFEATNTTILAINDLSDDTVNL